MGEQNISNFNSYNAEMKKSLLDKVYFMDKVESNVFVDFGCADGELIKFLNALFPEYFYIGYDIDPKMIDLAKSNLSVNDILPNNILLTDNWDNVVSMCEHDNSTLILNSVIHEIYSYSNLIENDVFWNRCFGGIFDYIVVRDMLPKRSINKKSDINDIVKLRRHSDKGQLMDYEEHWGSIEENKNLIHFLLKYRWKNNWNREVSENYFPLYAEAFVEKIPVNFVIDFYDEFSVPFTKRKIEQDFGIILKDTTHVKCIIRKIK